MVLFALRNHTKTHTGHKTSENNEKEKVLGRGLLSIISSITEKIIDHTDGEL